MALYKFAFNFNFKAAHAYPCRPVYYTLLPICSALLCHTLHNEKNK